MNLWLIFITGLTVGGLTCVAIQGGLLASVLATQKSASEADPDKLPPPAWLTTLVFLLFKLISHILLGFLLGLFGQTVSIQGNLQTFMQFAAGLYMIAVALNLLEVHPIFRYVIIQPPRFLTRLVRQSSRSAAFFSPAVVGFMTIFIPCGTTLAMETLAISTANPWLGAAVMGAFILGTIPMFVGIGFLTSLLGTALRSRFLKIAAYAVILVGLNSLNGSLVAWGSPISFSALVDTLRITPEQALASSASVSQNLTINITSRGYTPNRLKVKSGSQVTVNLVNADAYSCASAFRIPSLGISKNVGPGESTVFTFTPTSPGNITFACSMGMYRGVIEVI